MSAVSNRASSMRFPSGFESVQNRVDREELPQGSKESQAAFYLMGLKAFGWAQHKSVQGTARTGSIATLRKFSGEYDKLSEDARSSAMWEVFPQGDKVLPEFQDRALSLYQSSSSDYKNSKVAAPSPLTDDNHITKKDALKLVERIQPALSADQKANAERWKLTTDACASKDATLAAMAHLLVGQRLQFSHGQREATATGVTKAELWRARERSQNISAAPEINPLSTVVMGYVLTTRRGLGNMESELLEAQMPPTSWRPFDEKYPIPICPGTGFYALKEHEASVYAKRQQLINIAKLSDLACNAIVSADCNGPKSKIGSPVYSTVSQASAEAHNELRGRAQLESLSSGIAVPKAAANIIVRNHGGLDPADPDNV